MDKLSLKVKVKGKTGFKLNVESRYMKTNSQEKNSSYLFGAIEWISAAHSDAVGVSDRRLFLPRTLDCTIRVAGRFPLNDDITYKITFYKIFNYFNVVSYWL